MAEFFNFLIEHGYTVLFIWVALDQAGLPLPAAPLLLAAGALAGMGQLSLPLILVICLVASIPINWFWFWAGRLRGMRVLHLLCILSLEPDYCVRDTETLFRKLGPVSVVVAKFVPGLQMLAPPMSGLTGMGTALFLVLNTLGTFLWAAVFTGIGVYFSSELESMATMIAEAGVVAGIVIGLLVGAYFVYKLVHRHLFVRSLRMRRLSPQEVFERAQREDDFHILDLRHNYDFRSLPHLLPGALRVPMESIERHHGRIPPDSDIVLYCS